MSHPTAVEDGLPGSTPGRPVQPARELAANKTKQNQIEPSKKAWISLVFFGGIGAFQRVTGEKNKKILSVTARVEGCAQNVSNPIFPSFSSRRGACCENADPIPQVRRL
jgi:hypothetical protein